MKKQYVFLFLILVMLYSIFLISTYKYKEYKVNKSIENVASLISEIKEDIKDADDIISYKKSAAYRNKVLKEEQWLKNNWEIVIYLTSEKKYNKFTKEEEIPEEILETENSPISWFEDLQYMTIFQKWKHLLFSK